MVDSQSVNAKHSMTTLITEFGPNIEQARELAPLSSYKTGGKAAYFISVKSREDITRSVRAAQKLEIPFFILGGGTNLLVSDKGFEGVIVKIEVAGLKLKSETEITCGAGEDLMDLVNFATSNDLSGMEFAAGIWGTVGGAVYGNAGAYGGEIGCVITRITLVDSDGQVKTVGPEYAKFGYRDSYFKVTKDIIVEVDIKLEKGNRADIQKKVDEILKLRDKKFCTVGKSAGCFFKNIPAPDQPFGKLSAGKLLDEAGVKDLTVGDAKVFENHANIIVNKGRATSKDIRQLADKMKEKVKEKFGIELTEEIQELGEF